MTLRPKANVKLPESTGIQPRWQNWMACFYCQTREVYCLGCRERRKEFEATGKCGPPPQRSLMTDLEVFLEARNYKCEEVDDLQTQHSSAVIRVFSEGATGFIRLANARFERLMNHVSLSTLREYPVTNALVPLESVRSRVLGLQERLHDEVAALHEEVAALHEEVAALHQYYQGAVPKSHLVKIGMRLPGGLAETQPPMLLEYPGVRQSRFDRETPNNSKEDETYV